MTLARGAAAMLLLAGVGTGVAISWRIPQLLVDEMHYGPQIRAFVEGRFELDPAITMLPGYHLAVAALLRLAGGYGDHAARLATLAGSLFLVPLAVRLAAREQPDAWMRAAQAFFMPLLFPYLFLMYTEGWTMVAFAALVYFTTTRRSGLAALAGAFGIAMRQDFAAWVAMAWAMAAWREAGAQRQGAVLARAALVTWPYALVLAAFAVFVAANGAVALGDRSRHEGGVNLANVDLMLACGFVLFLPANLRALPAVAALVRRPLVIFALVAGFCAYWLTWSNPHPYNQVEPAYLRFFLHNRLLHAIDTHAALRAALFVPIAWMVLTAVAAADAVAALRWPLAVALAVAALHPLVEPRYYLPGFVLFNLWRPALPAALERATLAAYVAAAIALLAGISAVRFFP